MSLNEHLRMTSIVNQLKRHNLELCILGCFLFEWLVAFPFIKAFDCYKEDLNQWGVFMALVMKVVNLFFGGFRGLNYIFLTLSHTLLLYYSVYRINRLLQSRIVLAFSLFFFLFCSYNLFCDSADLFFLSVLSFFICRLLNFYYKGRQLDTWQLLLLIIVTTACAGYRKNAIVVLPFLLYPLFSLSVHSCGWSKLKLLSLSVATSIVLSIPLHTKILSPLLHLTDTYGECVFQVSDVTCVHQLLGRYDSVYEAHTQRPVPVFMQCYNVEMEFRVDNADKIHDDWKDAIIHYPELFVECRVFNFIQFLTLGCVPSWINQIMRDRHPDVVLNLPSGNDFPMVIHGLNLYRSPDDKNEIYDRTYYTQSGWNFSDAYLKSYSRFKAYWPFISYVLLSIYFIGAVFGFCVLFVWKRRRELRHDLLPIVWVGLLFVVYMGSFLPFVPTPDFRYHLAPIFLSLLFVSMSARLLFRKGKD